MKDDARRNASEKSSRRTPTYSPSQWLKILETDGVDGAVKPNLKLENVSAHVHYVANNCCTTLDLNLSEEDYHAMCEIYQKYLNNARSKDDTEAVDYWSGFNDFYPSVRTKAYSSSKVFKNGVLRQSLTRDEWEELRSETFTAILAFGKPWVYDIDGATCRGISMYCNRLYDGSDAESHSRYVLNTV